MTHLTMPVGARGGRALVCTSIIIMCLAHSLHLFPNSSLYLCTFPHIHVVLTLGGLLQMSDFPFLLSIFPYISHLLSVAGI